MNRKRKTRLAALALLPLFLAIFVVTRTARLVKPSHSVAAGSASFAEPLQSNPAPASPSDPWTAAQTVQPATLAKEIAYPDSAKRPIVVCVAPHVLYSGGHIPGALYHGPGKDAQGTADLNKWAQGVPRSTNIVVYCGCCPLERCPNLRPAFSALQGMGFTHLRALILPTNFYTDWAKPGFPVEK